MFIQQLGNSSRKASRTRLSLPPQVQTLAESWAQGARGPRAHFHSKGGPLCVYTVDKPVEGIGERRALRWRLV